jgi:hypothetical protein
MSCAKNAADEFTAAAVVLDNGTCNLRSLLERQLRPLVELKGEPGISDELDRRRVEAERDQPPFGG